MEKLKTESVKPDIIIEATNADHLEGKNRLTKRHCLSVSICAIGGGDRIKLLLQPLIKPVKGFCLHFFVKLMRPWVKGTFVVILFTSFLIDVT